MTLEMATFAEFLLGQFYSLPTWAEVQDTFIWAYISLSILQTAVKPLLKIRAAMTIFVLFTLPRSLVIVFSIGFYSNYNWAKKYQLKSQHWPFKQPGHPKLFFMQVNLIIPLYCYFGGGGLNNTCTSLTVFTYFFIIVCWILFTSVVFS